MLVKDLIIEEVELPLWYSIIQSGLTKGRNFYFASGANRIWDLNAQKSAGQWTITLRLEKAKARPGSQAEKKTYTIWQKDRQSGVGGFSKWTLKKFEDGHRLVMVRETNEDVSEPLIVRLINQKIAKGGAVLVDIPKMTGGTFKGWVTTPIVAVQTKNGLDEPTGTMYKIKTNDHPSGAKGKVKYLSQDADNRYTLVPGKDKNGNRTLTMKARDAAE